MRQVGLLLLCCGTASAWITTSQHQRDAAAASLELLRKSNGALNRIWNAPTDATTSAGLGGGLTFAYDRKICEDLLPAFSEATGPFGGFSFVDCDTIYAAIRTAFSSWATNHPYLKFNDITADCAARGDFSGGPFGEGCSRAEIYLTTRANASSQDSAATTINEFVWEVCVRVYICRLLLSEHERAHSHVGALRAPTESACPATHPLPLLARACTAHVSQIGPRSHVRR